MTKSLFLKIFLSLNLCFALSFPQRATAQDTTTTFKRSLATVLFSSLGGAVLGLSTLSFYKDAQKHTNNISIGAILGLAGGLTYVAYQGSESYVSDGYSGEFEKQSAPFFNEAPVMIYYSWNY